MDQPSRGERALSDEPTAQPGTPQAPGKKRDAKSLSLVAAGMLTIVASVITLFVDKLSLPLRVSLILGLLGIGLTGAAVIMQAAPERWARPVAAVAAGTVVLMTMTFFLAPHPGAASTPGSTAQTQGELTLSINPDHGGISDTLFVSGTGCPLPGGEIHIYFDGIDLFDAAICQADHTYRKSYRPYPHRGLQYFEDGQWQYLPLSPGSTHPLYAETTNGASVSPDVTYRVG